MGAAAEVMLGPATLALAPHTTHRHLRACMYSQKTILAFAVYFLSRACVLRLIMCSFTHTVHDDHNNQPIPGDTIIEVNGAKLLGLPHSAAHGLLRDTSDATIVVSRAAREFVIHADSSGS